MTCKKTAYFFLLIAMVILIRHRVYGGETDSLQTALQSATSDSVKGLIYLQLAKRASLAEPVKGFEYLNKGLDLGASVGRTVRAELQMELGNYQRLTGDYSNAIKNILAALAIFEDGKHTHANDAEKINMRRKTANCYNNLAIAYFVSGKSDEAEQMLKKALALYEQLNDESNVSAVLNNIGELYQKRGNPKIAEQYYHKAYNIALLQNDLHLQSVLMNNFGDTNYNLGKYSRAIYFQGRALKMANELKDVEGISYSYLALAKAYHKLFNYDSALYCGQRGLALAKENKINYLIKDGLLILKNIHFSDGDFEKAMRYADSVIFLMDTIYSQDKNKLINQSQLQYELGRQQSQIELLEKESIINNQKLVNAELNKNIVYTILAAVIVIASMLFYYWRERQIQNDKLSYKNQVLDAKNKELKMLNDTKDKLFSIISHDLRAPLSALKNVLDLVDFNLLSPSDFAQLAADVRKNLKNILYTLNNLLEWSYSQIKTGDTINPEINDLKEIIQETIFFYEEVARQKEIDIITNISDKALAKADKNHLRFVLRNLLNNAIKFSYPRSEVLIEAVTLPNNRVEIAVKDKGAGIEDTVREQLFSPSVRSTKGTAGEQGTGLGLLLCKDFIEKNGGEISVDSEVGKGTTFKIILWYQ